MVDLGMEQGTLKVLAWYTRRGGNGGFNQILSGDTKAYWGFGRY